MGVEWLSSLISNQGQDTLKWKDWRSIYVIYGLTVAWEKQTYFH